jgi:hypothetical protein
MGNMSNAVEMIFDRAKGKYAYAFARKQNAMADLFHDLFVTALTDDSVTDDVTRPLYVGMWETAQTIATAAGDPLKRQDDKSRNSQVSKLANAYTLAVVARDHDSVSEAMDYAKRKAAGGYNATIKAAVAMKAVCLKAEKAGVAPELDDMREAIDKALKAKADDLASVKVAKALKSWIALTIGTDEEPSDYADAFASLLSAYPQDFARHVASSLADCAAALRKMEVAAEPLPSVAGGKV